MNQDLKAVEKLLGVTPITLKWGRKVVDRGPGKGAIKHYASYENYYLWIYRHVDKVKHTCHYHWILQKKGSNKPDIHGNANSLFKARAAVRLQLQASL